jgi:hypothetical protein
MLADVKYAIRQLKKSPGFTVTAVLTLALGIGANAVVFSVLNALVLRPLNVPHPQNLFMVQRLAGQMMSPSQSYLDYKDLRDRNRSFDSLIAYNIMGPVGLDTGGNPSTMWPYAASGNYFDGLGIQPYLGRFFHAADEHGNNSAPFVVLGYAYWHSQFHDDRGAVGRVVQINKHPFTIIGVAPPDFRGTELFFAPALWIPMVDQPEVEGSDDLQYRGNHSMFVAGRLKAGMNAAQATADLNAIGASLAKAYPGDDDGVKFSLARPGLVGDMLGGPARAFVAGLTDSAGGVREPGQFVRGACRGSGEGDCAADGAGIAAPADFAAAADGSGAGVAGGWSGGAGGRHWDPALVDRMAAGTGRADQCAGESGCVDVCCGVRAGAVERAVVWDRAGAAGNEVGSVADYSVRRDEPRRDAAVHAARSAAGGADCYLRSAGYVVASGGAWTGEVAAQQFWIRSEGRDAGGNRSADGWIQR